MTADDDETEDGEDAQPEPAGNGLSPRFRYLTQAEVAERLQCSVDKVRRLRMAGDLEYLKCRPPLISEAAVEDYLRRAKRWGRHAPALPSDTAQMSAEEQAERDRVRRIWLRHHSAHFRGIPRGGSAAKKRKRPR